MYVCPVNDYRDVTLHNMLVYAESYTITVATGGHFVAAVTYCATKIR